MKRRLFIAGQAALLLFAAWLPLAANAQAPVLMHDDHELMLASQDPTLAANKRLVYDFWREVLEANHFELATKYLDENYIQHNPNVPSGRQGFVDFFSRRGNPLPIVPRIKSPLVAIIAEGDLVVLSFVHRGGPPTDPTKQYTTTWFDMFRLKNGKIMEHWDPATKG
jgi:predicted SnoaL-like aldol condensation-catalyzing enzyme